MTEPYRLVVTGSRYYVSTEHKFDCLMDKVLQTLVALRGEMTLDPMVLHIAEGGARGADEEIRKWASRMDPERVILRTFEADWAGDGRKAGPIRNKRMLEIHNPELVLAFWDGSTKGSGTFDCLQKATNLGIPVLIEPTKRKI